MDAPDARRHDEALAWVRRIQDPHFGAWEAHADWLDADPRNADAFDEASLLIDDAVAGLGRATPRVRSANDNAVATAVATAAPRAPRRFGLGIAIAAGVAALVAIPVLMTRTGDGAYTVGTAVGEHRTVSLADGTRIALNGGSVLRLDRGAPRTASLDRGEAYFTVAHDAAHPFTVAAGDATFQDAGTAFDVVREGGTARAAVHDGAVLYDPAGAAVRLDRGDAIEIAQGVATVRHVDAAAVGDWRSGRLSYVDTPMTQVAADLARSIGAPVRIDAGAAATRFTGVIVIDPDRTRMFRRVAAITGAEIRREGAGWRMALPTR